ncbi:MAG TPA: FAD/NAD(P)-binding oxidoreductase [Mycobacterium sp.]|nr:FAD/NAD(P)-binding oxidoreductase [Mycobacterium sp.]
MGKTVVVLGAGQGGLAAAERLRAIVPPADRVELIDRSFTGSLGLSALRVLRGWNTAEQVTTTVTAAALPGVSMTTAEVVGIDPEAKTVRYHSRDVDTEIGYDALVVALGATLNTAAVPGLDEAMSRGLAGQFYTPDGAAELHRRIDTLESGRVLVLIAAMPFKCPPAPYEAAFMIAELLGERFTAGHVKVDVFTCEPRPIGVASCEVGDSLVGMIEARRIGFHPGKSTAAVDADARMVHFADGSAEAFDVLAVVPPHASPVAATLAGGVNPAGWIPVDSATMATSLPGVWAVGDNTALMLANDKPIPKAGFAAEAGARTAADQIARYLGYSAPDSRLVAEGGCIVEVGGGLAAMIAGEFTAVPAPLVQMHEPSASLHAEKERQEREWLTRWSVLPAQT